MNELRSERQRGINWGQWTEKDISSQRNSMNKDSSVGKAYSLIPDTWSALKVEHKVGETWYTMRVTKQQW